MNNKGLLISVEGVDAVGKKTQVDLLKQKLISDGYKVKVYSFPEYDTSTGKLIASYLKGEMGSIEQVPKKLICLAYGADRAKRANEINKLLDEGYIVLCDRYTYSNIFTIAKLQQTEWDDFFNWIEEIEFDCLGVVKPNYNIYLYIDPQISINRIKERGKREYQDGENDIHESNFNLLSSASKAYLYFANKNNNWIIIDEMKNNKQMSIDDISNILYDEIKKIIKSTI